VSEWVSEWAGVKVSEWASECEGRVGVSEWVGDWESGSKRMKESERVGEWASEQMSGSGRVRVRECESLSESEWVYVSILLQEPNV
jgi:hypothetical protein